MADDPNVTSLAFDPNYMGARTEFSGAPRPPAPTTQAIQQQQRNPGDAPGVTLSMDAGAPNGGDIWARVQEAAKRGLISPAQVEAIGKKLGYTSSPLGGNFATGVKEPDYAGSSNPASNVGDAAANLITRGGNAIKSAMSRPEQPAPPLDLGVGGINPPSPAWNQ